MKHYISLGIILFLTTIIIIEAHTKSKKKASKTKKKKGKSSGEGIGLPINFKINQDSFIAASIIKTLGVRFNLEYLIAKIQKNCKRLKVVKLIRDSIKKINRLTEPSDRIGFNIARSQIRDFFGKRLRRRDLRYYGIKVRHVKRIFSRSYFSSANFEKNHDSFRSTVGKKKSTKGKRKNKRSKMKRMSKIERLCRSKGFYNAAMGRFQRIRERLRRLKKRKLIQVIKRTLRRMLARMLGCYYVRYSKFSKIIRQAQQRITTRGISTNVKQLVRMLKSISKNYKPKPKTVRKSKKIMKKIFSKIITGKKVNLKTKILIKKLAKNNCRAAKACFKHHIYTKKCYQVSRLCLTIKSVVKKIKAKKVGSVVSKLLKHFFKKKK